MIRRLQIRNYLLIEQLDLELGDGLTIITGETGSGKSILIGALGLAMGERAEQGVLRDGSARCVIELEVDLEGLGLEGWFQAQELPFERQAILRRQLEPGGRSRAFVNDTPVRLEQLRELGGRLVHVHSQHHTLLLNDAQFQLGLVDHLAGHVHLVYRYRELYRTLRDTATELAQRRDEEARARLEADLIAFQLNELDLLMPRPGEEEQLEQDLARADHAEELIQALQHVEQGLEGEQGALAVLVTLRQALIRPARFAPDVKALLGRLDSAHIELKDIASEAAALAGGVTMDPREAARMRERLDSLHRLHQKHRVRSNVELIALQEDLRGRTERHSTLDERIQNLERQQEELFVQAAALALDLSKGRGAALVKLGEEVEAILHDLGMPHAVFRFEHRTHPAASPADLGPQGVDVVRALFSANKDRPPARLDKVASGGELSRVMLALISLAAHSQGLPTVVFDEIDTGVSGEVADRVGSLMARMGRDRQVLAITHLPQIASKAGHHLLVSKRTEEEVVRTRIEPLDKERRVEAIAQMLSGRKLTKAALENARVLLGQR